MKKITIDQLNFSYDQQTKIIDNLSLSFAPGFSLLIGKTGCGKSTLLKILAGLYPKYAGQMQGKVDLAGQSVGMMFQNATEQFTMPTARQEIIFALENLQVNPKLYEKRLKNALAVSEIAPLLDQKISTLSGGEKQKVALAVLVAMRVDVFLLDEPFASCDPQSRRFLIKKLAELAQKGKTIIISDHLFSDYQAVTQQIYQFDQPTVKLLTNAQMAELFKQQKQTYHFALPETSSNYCFKLKQAKIRQNRLLLQQARLIIPQGKKILITGANGVGKSSFFKALTKMLTYEGKFLYQGQEIKKWPSRKYLGQVAQVFQEADDQFLQVSVRAELALCQKVPNPLFSQEQLDDILARLKLDQHLDQVVYELSGGQKKKLQILLMVMSNPQVLLLDEPLAGLDSQSIRAIRYLLSCLVNSTILIISHQLSGIADFCDYHLAFAKQQLTYTKEVVG